MDQLITQVIQIMMDGAYGGIFLERPESVDYVSILILFLLFFDQRVRRAHLAEIFDIHLNIELIPQFKTALCGTEERSIEQQIISLSFRFMAALMHFHQMIDKKKGHTETRPRAFSPKNASRTQRERNQSGLEYLKGRVGRNFFLTIQQI